MFLRPRPRYCHLHNIITVAISFPRASTRSHHHGQTTFILTRIIHHSHNDTIIHIPHGFPHVLCNVCEKEKARDTNRACPYSRGHALLARRGRENARQAWEKAVFFFLFFLSSPLLFLLRVPRTDVRRLCYETIYYHLVLAKVNNNNDGYTTRANRRQVRSLGFAAVRERRWRDLHPDGMESPRNQSLILSNR